MSTTVKPPFIQPYLFFEGRFEEALEFYKTTLGAEVTMLMRIKDSPEPPAAGCVPPGSENKVMHGEFKIGSTVIMGSDGRCSGKPNFEGFGLTLSVANEGEAESAFGALAAGGEIVMPLSKTFFSPRFGMVADKFGVTWMVIVPQAPPK